MEVLDYDPGTGVQTNYHYDDSEKRVYIETVQDPNYVKAIVDAATTLRNDEEYIRKGIKQSWAHVCMIPAHVMNEMVTKYGISQPLRHGKEVLKIIQRDYAYLMTAKGRF